VPSEDEVVLAEIKSLANPDCSLQEAPRGRLSLNRDGGVLLPMIH